MIFNPNLNYYFTSLGLAPCIIMQQITEIITNMNFERNPTEEQITKRMVELYDEFVAKNKNANLQKKQEEVFLNDEENERRLSEFVKQEVFAN